MTPAERIARAFHDTYEKLAPAYCYETREASRVHWALVPAENKKLMIAVAQTLLDEGKIMDPVRPGPHHHEYVAGRCVVCGFESSAPDVWTSSRSPFGV